jgi:hypothetical protein
LGRFGRRLFGIVAAQHDVLDIHRVRFGFPGGIREAERGQQLARVDRIGERLKQLKRPEPAFEQLEPLTLRCEDPQSGRPAFGHLAEQLEAGAVREPLAGDDHLEFILAQQVEAIRLGSDGIDGKPLA